MEILFALLFVLMSVAVSLGVGCSTVAIINFFTAIADGKIDESERHMMGSTYVLLRIAMVLILCTYAGLWLFGAIGVATTLYATTTSIAVAILVSVLYTNAILMTYRIMPSTFGPAIQAGSWYTLGVVMALASISITSYSLPVFLLGYACVVTLAVSLVNLGMTYLKHRKPAEQQ